jgi:hypothetical protein
MLSKSFTAHRLAIAGAAWLIASVCVARDVTYWEIEEIRAAVRRLVAQDEEVLKVQADWAQIEGAQQLGAMVTTRPFDVEDGLCVAESYMLRRKEGESEFRLLNEGWPISRYWQRAQSCDVIRAEQINEFGVIPGTVSVAQPIATTHVGRIIRGADEILALAAPDIWCNERIMPTLFQRNVTLRLTSIELDRWNRRSAGIWYMAYYTRKGPDSDGITVRFTLVGDRFELSRVCYWIA